MECRGTLVGTSEKHYYIGGYFNSQFISRIQWRYEWSVYGLLISGRAYDDATTRRSWSVTRNIDKPYTNRKFTSLAPIHHQLLSVDLSLTINQFPISSYLVFSDSWSVLPQLAESVTITFWRNIKLHPAFYWTVSRNCRHLLTRYE